jgi:hypothetical protein
MTLFSIEILKSEFSMRSAINIFSEAQKINKQIRGFSVSKVQPSQDFKLDPQFITGFTDAEGSFSIIVAKSNNLKVQ